MKQMRNRPVMKLDSNKSLHSIQQTTREIFQFPAPASQHLQATITQLGGQKKSQRVEPQPPTTIRPLHGLIIYCPSTCWRSLCYLNEIIIYEFFLNKLCDLFATVVDLKLEIRKHVKAFAEQCSCTPLCRLRPADSHDVRGQDAFQCWTPKRRPCLLRS